MEGAELHEACGVAAVADLEEGAPQLAVQALISLQHRGQESAGVASVDGEGLQLERGMGLVSEVFPSGRPDSRLAVSKAANGPARSRISWSGKM